MNVKWVGMKCTSCGEKPIRCRGLCNTCYSRWRRRRLGMKENRWWGKCTECRLCGAKPVSARGLCKSCYGRILERYHRDRRRIQKYRAGERYRFGGDRQQIIANASGSCQLCGMTEAEAIRRWNRKLDVHHIDGRGRTSDSPNHSKDNLLVVCRICHMAIHHPKGQKIGAVGRTT